MFAGAGGQPGEQAGQEWHQGISRGTWYSECVDAQQGIDNCSPQPALKLLQEAQNKLQEVRVILEDQKACTKLPVQSPNIKPAETPKKILRFSSPSQSEACTIYPRTPHPLHNMTCVVDGPQLASTPVCTESSSPLMNLSPHMINYSDSEEEESSLSNEHSHKQPNGEEYKTVSPTMEKQSLQDQSNHDNKSTNSTLDQLEAALSMYIAPIVHANRYTPLPLYVQSHSP